MRMHFHVPTKMGPSKVAFKSYFLSKEQKGQVNTSVVEETVSILRDSKFSRHHQKEKRKSLDINIDIGDMH